MSLELGAAVPWLTHVDNFLGAFDASVTDFVKLHGRHVHLRDLPHVSCWTVSLQGTRGPLQLQIYRETNDESGADLCDQCRIMGWHNHPVCTCRYHFIIPVIENMYITAASVQDLSVHTEAYYTAPTAFDSHAHLLHGVIHANGFGHLARVNGREGGSSKLTGKQLMTVWDSLCQLLRARQISVEDVSNKGGMELRVLHAAAYKTTWYGKWGYQYGRGAFNITHSKWKKAVDAVHRAKLALLLADFAGVNSAVPSIVARYRAVEQECNNLGALLQRMLGLLSKPHEAAELFAKEQAAASMAAASEDAMDQQPSDAQEPCSAPLSALPASSQADVKAGQASNGALHVPPLGPASASHTDETKFVGGLAQHVGPMQQPLEAHPLAQVLTDAGQGEQADTALKPVIQPQTAHRQTRVKQLDTGPDSPMQPQIADSQGQQVSMDMKPSEPVQTARSQEQVKQPTASMQPPVHLQTPDSQGQVKQPTINTQAPVHPQTADTEGYVKPRDTEFGPSAQSQAAASQSLVKQECLQVSAIGQKPSTAKKAGQVVHGTPAVKLTGSAATAMALVQAGKHRPRSSKLSSDQGALLPRKPRPKGSATAPGSTPPAMPAGKLPYSLSGLTEVTLCDAHKRWSADRCRNSLAKVVPALQVFEGWWVPRGRVRQEVQKYIGDSGIMDFMLKAICNHTYGPWAVFRQTGSTQASRTLFYLIVKKDGSSKLPDLNAVFHDATATDTAEAPAVPTQQPGSADAVQPNGLASSSALASRSAVVTAPAPAGLAVPAAPATVSAAIDIVASKSAATAPPPPAPVAQQSASLSAQLLPDPGTSQAGLVSQVAPQIITAQEAASDAYKQTCASESDKRSSMRHDTADRAPSALLQLITQKAPPVQLQTHDGPEHQHVLATHLQPSLSDAGLVHSAADPLLHPDKLGQQTWPNGAHLGGRHVLPQSAAAGDSGGTAGPVPLGPSHSVPPAKPGTAQVDEGTLVPMSSGMYHRPSISAYPNLHIGASPAMLQLPTDDRGEAAASDRQALSLMAGCTAEEGSVARTVPLPAMIGLEHHKPAADAAVPIQHKSDGVSQAASPQQGDLLGVLGAACSQIIAQQQARSPTAAVQQSPQQWLSAQHVEQEHHLQHDPSQQMLPLGLQTQPQLHHKLQPQLKPGLQADVHSSELQESRLSPPDAGTFGEELAVLVPFRKATQLETLLPEELDNRWASMLVDHQEHPQLDATCLLEHAQAESQPQQLPLVTSVSLQGAKPEPCEEQQAQRNGQQQGGHHASSCSPQGMPDTSPQADSPTATEEVDIMEPQPDVDMQDAHTTSEACLGTTRQSESVTTEDVDIMGPKLPDAMLPGTGRSNLPAQELQLDASEHQKPNAEALTQQQQQHRQLRAGATDADSDLQQLDQIVMSTAASVDTSAPSAALPLDQLEHQSLPDAVVEEQLPTGGSSSEAAWVAVPQVAEPLLLQDSEQTQEQQPLQQIVAAPDVSTAQHIAEPAGAVSDKQLLHLPSAPDIAPPGSREHHFDKAAGTSAADMASDRPRTRLRRSLQAASSTPASTHAMLLPKAMPEPAPQPKPKSPSATKSKSSLAKRPSGQSAAAKSKQAKHAHQAGAALPEKLPQAAHASKTQPQHPCPDKAADMAVTKGKRSVEAGKRKHADMITGGQEQVAQGSPAAKGAVSAAGEKRPSGSRQSGSKGAKPTLSADKPAEMPSRASSTKGSEKQQGKLPAAKSNLRPSRQKPSEDEPTAMQIDAPASSASPRAKRAKLESASPSSKQQARSPRGQQQADPPSARQTRSPAQAGTAGSGASPSKPGNAQALKQSPPSAMPKRSSKSAEGGSMKHSARKAAGLSNKAADIEPLKHSAKLSAGPSSQAASIEASRHSARVSAGLLKEVQDLQAGLEGQGSPIVPSRTRRKAAVDYHEGVKLKGSAAAAANPLAKRRRAAPDSALASCRPPPVLHLQPWHTLQPGALFNPTPGLQAQDQVLCDLVYLFNNVLRAYAPAEGHEILLQLPGLQQASGQQLLLPQGKQLQPSMAGSSVQPKVEQESNRAQRLSKLKLKHLVVEAHMLRDVKHFVKDYQGHLALPLPHLGVPGQYAAEEAASSDSCPGQVRLLLQVTLPEEGPSPSPAPSSPVSAKPAAPAAAKASSPPAAVAGRRPSLPPPVQPLLVPRRASLAQVKKAAQAAMADVYLMLQHWQVDNVQGLENSELRNKVGYNIPDGSIVHLLGSNVDTSAALRHAGGPEDWIVSCTCGAGVDDGERMVACDVCGVWMHTRCQGMPDADPIPDKFVCHSCLNATQSAN